LYQNPDVVGLSPSFVTEQAFAQVYPEWQMPFGNLKNAVMDLKEREQKADIKAMANMYSLALAAQLRIPGRCFLAPVVLLHLQCGALSAYPHFVPTAHRIIWMQCCTRHELNSARSNSYGLECSPYGLEYSSRSFLRW
jgi:hypothetical protein